MLGENITFQLSTVGAGAACVALASAYVFSLYLWRTANTDRDNPETIKRRFISVLAVCAVSPVFLWLISSPVGPSSGHSLFQLLGVKLTGFVTAVFAPLALTMVLFLGPLALQYQEGYLLLYADPHFWIEAFKDVYWLRSHVMAPLTEEFIFRACMLALLIPCLGSVKAILFAPLVFGIAHLHHAYEMISQGRSLKEAAIICTFQFVYTTIFGVYSGYLFVKTGHVMSVIIVHAFCNHMGFPDFGAVFSFKSRLVRGLLIACFICGAIGWYWCLGLLTDPRLYHNNVYRL